MLKLKDINQGDLVNYYDDGCIVIEVLTSGLVLCNLKTKEVRTSYKAKGVYLVKKASYQIFIDN